MKSYFCITGATGGLGKAFVYECAARGYNLLLTDRSESALATLAKSMENRFGTKVICVPCDLMNEQSCKAFVHQIGAFQFCGLINVAGLDFEGVFSELSPLQIQTILRVNIESNLILTQAVLAHKSNNEHFRLINICSLAAYYPMPVKATYAASKRFLLDFTMAMREELKVCGGTATALCSGGLPTCKEAIRGIYAQGIFGIWTTSNTGFVAHKTMNAALKGKATYVPGLLNKFLRMGSYLLPPTLIAKIVEKRFYKAHYQTTVTTDLKASV